MKAKFLLLSSILLLLFFCINVIYSQENVGISDTPITPHPSSMLEVSSDNKGVLIPRMTSAQRMGIVNPADGLLVYDTDSACVIFYSVGLLEWKSLCNLTGIGQLGPTGPQGPAGANGSPGPTGPQGPAGVTFKTGNTFSGTHTVTSTAWQNVPLSVSFTAQNTSAIIIFSASGFGYTNSMSYVQFRVLSNGASIGSTHEKIQNYDDWTGTVTPWSTSYTRFVTGLTVGVNYNITIQARRDGILGTYDAIINTALEGQHMTITVVQ